LIEFPKKKYKIIYADPPWSFNDKLNEGRRLKYDVLPTNEICELPVNELADEDCILFIWASFAMLEDVLRVIKAWGFQYKTLGFIWIKQYDNGKFCKGMGVWTRSNSEPCFIAVKGKPERYDKGISQIIQAKQREHSRKPDVIRHKIIELCGDLPRIELFARTKVHGWDVWGNDPKLENEPLEAFN